MSFLIYIVIVWFKRTRAAFVLIGIIIIAAIYIVAQQLNLTLTSSVFQAFFAVILIALVIIFQEEIRRFFERIARWGMNPRFRMQRAVVMLPEEVETIVRTLSDLAKEKIGALVVMRGKSPILGHLDGGTNLGGRLSEELLKSIFDIHSIGHDGAVVLEGKTVTRFKTYLPLSKNFKKLGHHGTRHAAALGLSEMTDALCLVVSEENGEISYARHGDLKPVSDANALSHVIDRFYKEIYPVREKKSHLDIIFKNYREKLIAVALAVLLWLVYVYGSAVIYKTVIVPVDFAELPRRLESVKSDPKSVAVTFSGQRKDVYFLSKGNVRMFLKTLHLRPGARKVSIMPSDISFPKDVSIEKIEPNKISIEVEEVPEKDEVSNED